MGRLGSLPVRWLFKALGLGVGVAVVRAPTGPVNRVALIIRPKKPVAKWVNSVTPDNPLPKKIILSNVEVVLVDVEVAENLEEWLSHYWELVFKWRLNGWYTDPEVWPKNLSLAMFHNWFDVNLADSVLDLGVVPYAGEDF